MDRKVNGNVYYKQMNRGKIGIISTIYLNYCGRRDGKKSIIKKDEKGIYISPLIINEISLYSFAMQQEYEKLIPLTMKLQSKIEIINKRTESEISNKYDNEENTKIERFLNFHILMAQKEELEFSLEKESKIVLLQCRKLYEILIERLSIYWIGILKNKDRNKEIPAVFNIIEYLPKYEYLQKICGVNSYGKQEDFQTD